MRLAPLDGGEEAERQPLWRRIGWMIAIWLASITVLGAVAYVLRLWLA